MLNLNEFGRKCTPESGFHSQHIWPHLSIHGTGQGALSSTGQGGGGREGHAEQQQNNSSRGNQGGADPISQTLPRTQPKALTLSLEGEGPQPTISSFLAAAALGWRHSTSFSRHRVHIRILFSTREKNWWWGQEEENRIFFFILKWCSQEWIVFVLFFNMITGPRHYSKTTIGYISKVLACMKKNKVPRKLSTNSSEQHSAQCWVQEKLLSCVLITRRLGNPILGENKGFSGIFLRSVSQSGSKLTVPQQSAIQKNQVRGSKTRPSEPSYLMG